MKIFIKAKPKSKKEYVKKIDDTHYIVAVHEPPVSGQANRALIRSVAEYFHLPPSQVTMLSGETSKQKTLDIPLTSDDMEKLDIQTKLI